MFAKCQSLNNPSLSCHLFFQANMVFHGNILQLKHTGLSLETAITFCIPQKRLARASSFVTQSIKKMHSRIEI